jgi:hypothetical protein
MLNSTSRYIIALVLLVLCLNLNIFSQHHISKYEKCWAVFHPVVALKIKKQLPLAMEMYHSVKKSRLLDTLESGGKLDAFRHTYTMAFLARSIKTKKLKKLGIAHEKGNKRQFTKNDLEFGERPDSLACEMDLRNNDLGFLIGSQNKTNSDQQLKELVIHEIQNGKAWYLKRNPQVQYVDCSNKTIDFSQFIARWYIPKCLIKTNE